MRTITLLLFSLMTNYSIGQSSASSCILGNCQNGWGIYEWSSGSKYYGEWKNGVQTGEGVFTWSTGEKYVGTWDHGVINGYGTQFFADGTKATGFWTEGKLTSTKYTAAACISGDCDNGFGIWVYDSGDKYTGYWKEGFRNGEGTYLYADGSKYVGNVEKNKRNGFGTYNWLDGTVYIGNWKDGVQDGYGTNTTSEGIVQTGVFENGKYVGVSSQNTSSLATTSKCLIGNCDDGWGIYEWNSGSNGGDKYIGEWKNGTREGEGVYTWKSGDKYIGTWVGGNINGYGTQYFANGTKSAGLWQNATLTSKNYTESACVSGDCSNGYGTWIYDTGDKYSGYYKDGSRSGQGIFLYSDGEKYIGNFENNKRDGFGTYYWTDGSFYVGTWKEGNQDGSGSYTKVDGTKETGRFEKGSYVGESTQQNNSIASASKCIAGDCDNGWGIYEWKSGSSSGDKYIGEWKNGNREGDGVYTWSNGDKYVGSWSGGVINGYGKQYFANGTKSTGLWQNAKLTSKDYTESACLSGDCNNGFGVWIFDEGDKYEGYWMDGKINGQGTYLYADGMTYIGNFDNNKRNGYGTFYWTNGANYAGNWKNGNQDGKGVYIKVDGTVEKGFWIDGTYKGEIDQSTNKTYFANNTTSTGSSSESNLNFENKKSSISDRIKAYVEEKVNQWQQKGEFEKTTDYKNRVTETSRSKRIEDFQKEAIVALKKDFKETVNFKNVKLGLYDADNESFLLSSDELGEFVIAVPVAEAPVFKQNFSVYQFSNPDFYIQENRFVLAYAEIVNPATQKKYIYDSKNNASYATTSINYKFNEIVIDVEDKAGGISSNIKKGTNSISVGKSEVDVDIPVNQTVKTNTYALIIGNEDYSTFQPGLSTEINVDFAVNDAKIFKEYCVKTFGIPEKQVKLLINATSAQMSQGIAWLTNLAKVEEGNGEILFYYSGHGLPDEQTKEGYLIPVDVSGANANQGIRLNDLYAKLNEYPSKKVTVFLDACFSGGARNQGLYAMKGVKVKPKENVVNGNMVVFTSSTGEESSGVYREKQHGYMTYFLLKNIQESKGNISYRDLANSLISNVKKETALSGKVQTPQLNFSTAVDGAWETWKVK